MSNFSNELLNHIKQIEKKLESLEKENNAEWEKEHKRVTDHFLALGLEIKDLEAKLAKAVDIMNGLRCYMVDKEVAILEEINKTLAQPIEKGEGE